MQKISFSKKEGVNNMGYCSRSGYIKIHKFNFTKYFNSGNNIIIFFSAITVRVKLLLVWLLLLILHDKNRGDVIFTKNLKALLICCVNYVMTSGFCVHKYSTFVATGSIKRPLIYILTWQSASELKKIRIQFHSLRIANNCYIFEFFK